FSNFQRSFGFTFYPYFSIGSAKVRAFIIPTKFFFYFLKNIFKNLIDFFLELMPFFKSGRQRYREISW
ncbi:MAG: hypothetical protein KA319_06325, partial [Ferruginibacter sp.]|nr:hypothetical protein [Ferruginibacter sp.]